MQINDHVEWTRTGHECGVRAPLHGDVLADVLAPARVLEEACLRDLVGPFLRELGAYEYVLIEHITLLNS